MSHDHEHRFLLLLVLAVALGCLYINGAFSSGDALSGYSTYENSETSFAEDMTGFAVQEPETFHVVMKGNAFKPATITILVGDAVEWTNMDKAPHTVTADDARFDSKKQTPMIFRDQKFTHTFTRAGSFPYSCRIHSGMTGMVVVQDPSTVVAQEPPGEKVLVPSEETMPAKPPLKKTTPAKLSKSTTLKKPTSTAIQKGKKTDASSAKLKATTSVKPKATPSKQKRGALCTADAECTSLHCGLDKDKKKRCLGNLGAGTKCTSGFECARGLLCSFIQAGEPKTCMKRPAPMIISRNKNKN